MSPERRKKPVRRIANSIWDETRHLLWGTPKDISQRRRELREKGLAPPGPPPTFALGEGRPTIDYRGFREKDWEKVRDWLEIPRKAQGGSEE